MSGGRDLFSVICADGIALVRFFQLRFQGVLPQRKCRHEAWAATLEVLDKLHPILLDLEFIRKEHPAARFYPWERTVEGLMWMAAEEVYSTRCAKHGRGG